MVTAGPSDDSIAVLNETATSNDGSGIIVQLACCDFIRRVPPTWLLVVSIAAGDDNASALAEQVNHAHCAAALAVVSPRLGNASVKRAARRILSSAGAHAAARIGSHNTAAGSENGKRFRLCRVAFHCDGTITFSFQRRAAHAEAIITSVAVPVAEAARATVALLQVLSHQPHQSGSGFALDANGCDHTAWFYPAILSLPGVTARKAATCDQRLPQPCLAGAAIACAAHGVATVAHFAQRCIASLEGCSIDHEYDRACVLHHGDRHINFFDDHCAPIHGTTLAIAPCLWEAAATLPQEVASICIVATCAAPLFTRMTGAQPAADNSIVRALRRIALQRHQTGFSSIAIGFADEAFAVVTAQKLIRLMETPAAGSHWHNLFDAACSALGDVLYPPSPPPPATLSALEAMRRASARSATMTTKPTRGDSTLTVNPAPMIVKTHPSS